MGYMAQCIDCRHKVEVLSSALDGSDYLSYVILHCSFALFHVTQLWMGMFLGRRLPYYQPKA